MSVRGYAFRFAIFMYVIMSFGVLSASANTWDRESAFVAPHARAAGWLFNPLRYQANDTWAASRDTISSPRHPSIHVYQAPLPKARIGVSPLIMRWHCQARPYEMRYLWASWILKCKLLGGCCRA